MSRRATDSGYTCASTKQSSFTWTIKNYTYIKKDPKEKNKIESPEFSISPDDTDKWCITFYPYGHPKDTGDYVSIGFENKPIGHFEPIQVEFSIRLINKERFKDFISPRKHIQFLTKDGAGIFKLETISKGFIRNEDLLDYDLGFLINDQLTVICEYTVIGEPTSGYFPIWTKKHSPQASALRSNFEKLWESEKLSDFTLIAPCGKKLTAHKFILASHSPVFSAMFDSEMKETMVNQVEISDISFEGLREMLRFMYSDVIQNIDEVAGDVLIAAEKYQIPEIKYFCEDYFYENLNVENVVEILYLCLRFNLFDLLDDHICRFIKNNQKSVIESSGFKNMDDPDVLRFVSRSLVVD